MESVENNYTVNYSNTKNVSIFMSKKRKALLTLLREIDNNYNRIGINDAAAILKISKCHFSRYFHKKTGILFSEYMNFVRISNAIEIIKNDREILIKDVADICGFNNMRNFNRVFKAITQTNPKKVPNNFIFNFKNLLPIELRNYDEFF